MRRVKVVASGMTPPISADQDIDFTVGLMPINFQGYLNSAANRARVLETGTKAIRLQFSTSLDNDFEVQWAQDNGLDVMQFFYASGCNPETATGRQCYADRAATFVSNYTAIKWIEVWNEWNGGLGLGGPAGCAGVQGTICTDLVTYTDLLRRTYLAVKAARPSVKVVGAAAATVDLNWISDLYDEGGGNWMDVISCHPYVYHGTNAYTVPFTSIPDVAVASWVEGVTDLHNLGLAKTGRSIPIIVSEEGRSVAANPTSEQLTADFLSALYPAARNLPFLHGIFWFCIQDFLGLTWGLDRADATHRPAFASFQTVAGT